MELKTAVAVTHLQIWVNCPNCDNYQEVLDNVRESLGGELSVDECEEEVRCDECKEVFLIDRIEY